MLHVNENGLKNMYYLVCRQQYQKDHAAVLYAHLFYVFISCWRQLPKERQIVSGRDCVLIRIDTVVFYCNTKLEMQRTVSDCRTC